MMLCTQCSDRAVSSRPQLCKSHFIAYVEQKVVMAIDRFSLIRQGEKIAVAVSGGKDSQTVLYLLNKLYGGVTAISIDEGIPSYRDATLEDMKEFCARYSIPYQIHSFEHAFGQKLETFLQRGAPACRSCGVLRRHLLNKHAQGFDKIATGHNLDDECQNVLMNLLKGTLSLASKLGPMSGVMKREGFVQRIKPLYFCSEKEITTYAFLMGFPVRFNECPHATDGFRSAVRDRLNDLEFRQSGTKLRLIENFLMILPALKTIPEGMLRSCTNCGSPSANAVCNACKTVEAFAHA